MDAPRVVERVTLHEQSVPPRREHQPAGDVGGPASVGGHEGRPAERVDAAETIERVAHDTGGCAVRREHESSRDALARPKRVARHLGRTTERMDAAVEKVARGRPMRRPGRQHDLARADPVRPVHAAFHGGCAANRMQAAPSIHDVSAGAIREEREAVSDVLGRPRRGRRQGRRRADRVDAAPSIEHIEMVPIVDRRMHVRGSVADCAQGDFVPSSAGRAEQGSDD